MQLQAVWHRSFLADDSGHGGAGGQGKAEVDLRRLLAGIPVNLRQVCGTRVPWEVIHLRDSCHWRSCEAGSVYVFYLTSPL